MLHLGTHGSNLAVFVSGYAAVVLQPLQQQGQFGVTFESDRSFVIVELVGLPDLPLD